MVPVMAFSTPETFWYSGGVWDSSWLDWTWLNIAPDLRRRLGVAGPQTDEDAARSWDRDGAAPRRYDRVSAAVLNLSGWFDEMYGATGAVENFEGAGDALVLGPWVHGVGPV